MTQAELETQMQVLLAGTLAEEIVLKDISTGAQNDLERASAIARSMVMEFGMSRLGRVNYRETGRSPFLGGRAMEAYGKDHSEQTAREIDEEVRRIIDEMTQQARQILLERRTALENITRRLIEIEVIDSAELLRIIDQSLTTPRVKPGTIKPIAGKPSESELQEAQEIEKGNEDRGESSVG
jgi:cell division protease FtsH